MKTYKIKIDGKEYEVLGCPFCGRKPSHLPTRDGYTITCVNQACNFLVMSNLNCKDNQIEAWNTRT